jgi:hypothetical protein
MTNITKEIRQKTNEGQYISIPIGCDSKYVDMYNTNTLEEEFKLGGPCITSFNTIDGNTIIIEEYRRDNEETNFYRVNTIFSIISTGDTQIKQTLYFIRGENKNEEEIKSKIVIFQSNNNGIVIKEDIQ